MAKKTKKIEKNNKNWFKEFKAEIKKIIWPKGKDLFNNTVVVLSMVIIVSLMIIVLDTGFRTLSQFEVKQISNMKNKTEVNKTITNETVKEQNNGKESLEEKVSDTKKLDDKK